MKVAIYTGTYPDTTFLTLLVRKLAKEGVIVQIFGKVNKRTQEDKGIHFYKIPNPKLLKIIYLFKYIFLNALFNLNLLKKLVNGVLTQESSLFHQFNKLIILLPILYHKPDIIHIQWLKSYSLFLGTEHCFKNKFIISVRGHQLSISSFLYPEINDLAKKSFEHAHRIHSISDALTEQVKRISPTALSKTKKISPAIDHELFQQRSIKQKGKKLQIVTVARLTWNKGLNYGLKIIRKLLESEISCEYHLVGDGNQIEELLYLCNMMGLNKNVHFYGKISQENVLELLKKADVFFMPSIQEGFCNAVLEAQSVGVPCIVSDADGLPENVEHGKTGYIFQKKNIDSAVKAFNTFLLLNQKEYTKMQLNSAQRAREYFNLNEQIKKFKLLYQEVMIE